MNSILQVIEYWRAGGVLLLPLAVICFGMWFCFIRSRTRLMSALKEGRRVEAILDRLQSADKAAVWTERLAGMRGEFASTMNLALADIARGCPPRKAFVAREAEEMRILRRDLVLLTALTAAAPLLGLLGTVTGMIDTFNAVSAISGQTGSRVAAGISQALITTQFGLVIALPGVFGRARLDRLCRTLEVLMADCRSHVLAVLNRQNGGEKA